MCKLAYEYAKKTPQTKLVFPRTNRTCQSPQSRPLTELRLAVASRWRWLATFALLVRHESRGWTKGVFGRSNCASRLSLIGAHDCRRDGQARAARNQVGHHPRVSTVHVDFGDWQSRLTLCSVHHHQRRWHAASTPCSWHCTSKGADFHCSNSQPRNCREIRCVTYLLVVGVVGVGMFCRGF